ncbi:hypothetical protein NDU88_001450 [Pleurodeles waltl]|uniref:Reverse transcriptase domain-containing protein n=1 Tax=Pleurodeles waltl TaxID=8319 RepID=A0AAV7USU0_PLEWA|nr:hypothetical protein NDU88_001450 [Pleurodeles waltl]
MIRSLRTSRAPGEDGLPAEFYCKYTNTLAEHLLLVFQEALLNGILSASLREVIIVLIPKLGKDPGEVSSYRPLSMINVDAEVLSKVLTPRLLTYIAALVHEDQCIFIPRRNTLCNIQQLSLVLHAPAVWEDLCTVALLDKEQAFDSLNWEYLLHDLRNLGLNATFVKGFNYSIKTNGAGGEGSLSLVLSSAWDQTAVPAVCAGAIGLPTTFSDAGLGHAGILGETSSHALPVLSIPWETMATRYLGNEHISVCG